MISLPLVYNPLRNALEEVSELSIEIDAIIVGRYKVMAMIGKGTFSRVFQCLDLKLDRLVSIKVIRNDKDCFDAGLGELRVLSLLSKQDPHARLPRLCLYDYFYYREHLYIVTELLEDSLFDFYKHIGAAEPMGLRSYFTTSSIAKIAQQILATLQVLHSLGLTHSDIKPENVCFSSLASCEVKLIDFGSCMLEYDTTSSYVQSRWYRAPEVMLGIRWDAKIDMWSLGCLLCELTIGHPLFLGDSIAEVLSAQQAVLGPHPEHLLNSAHPSIFASLFTSATDATLYSVDPSGKPAGCYALRPRSTSLRDVLGMHDDDFYDLMEGLLAYDPSDRLSAEEAINHTFIRKHAEGPHAACASGTASPDSIMTPVTTPKPVDEHGG